MSSAFLHYLTETLSCSVKERKEKKRIEKKKKGKEKEGRKAKDNA